MKLLRDYKKELAELDTDRIDYQGEIDKWTKAGEEARRLMREYEGMQQRLKIKFNQDMKSAKSGFYQQKKARALASRQVKASKQALGNLPRRKSYLEKKIRELSRPVEPKKAPETKNKTAPVPGEGIEQIAGIIEDLSKKEVKPA